MNPDLQVRLAQTRDIAVLVAGNYHMALETEQRHLDEERLIRGVSAVFEDAHRGFYLVAESGGQVVGQLMVTFEWSDWRNGTFWWIQSVYVKPEARRMGVYRSLYQHLMTLAEGQPDICGVRLYVETHNTIAQETYQNLGMQKAHYHLYEVDRVLGS